MEQVRGPTVLSLIVGLLALTGSVYALGSAASTSNASPSTQSGTALSTDACIEVDEGDVVLVPIYIDNSPALFAFEIYFAYDPDLLEVVDKDVRLFLSDGPNSNVFDFSASVPNSTGLYRIGAADVALGGTAETGDGTLATITLVARDAGVSPAAIARSPGVIGPNLTTVGGSKIGDSDGDDIFDGPISSGQIAIDTSCNPVAPTVKPGIVQTPAPTQPPSTAGGSTNGPGETGGPGSTPDTGSEPTIVIVPSPEPTSAPDQTSQPGATDGPDASRTPRPSQAVSNNGGGAGDGGGSTGADNTLWAIVLIGGGVAMGLVITVVFARMTRKPA